MFSRKSVMALMAGFMLVGMADVAMADCRNKMDLFETSAAVSIDASGKAEVRARISPRRDDQRLNVSMDARVADGTTYSVYADGNLAGTITISLGSGELDLDNHDGNVLPIGVEPVCDISNVEVRDGGGTVILSGSF